MDNWINKIGFPVVKVLEQDGQVTVRQDRFLSSGPAKEEDNQTIWYVETILSLSKWPHKYSKYRTIPLSIVSVDGAGKAKVDKSAVLKEREAPLHVDPNGTFKINGGTTGFCRCNRRARIDKPV